jgi:hypothetical protein
LAASAGLAAGASLAVAGSAQATDFPVSGLDDAGGGTLRQAIINANGNSGPDTISFDSGLSGTITLASDLPTITQALAINGPGADKITVSGNDAHRIFDLNPTPAGDPVSISGLTLTGGRSASSVTAAIRGGAILNETAHLTISDSTISGNNGPGSGGGIYSGYPSSPTAGHHADLTVRRSTLSGNHASQGGGAIYLNDGSGHIIDSTISGNTAFWGGGVGIYYMQGPTVIENSTISGNTASGATPDRGGGLYIFRNPTGVTLSSTTVSGNTAEQGGGVFDYGYIPLSGPSSQAPVLHNTIIAGNTATGSGADVSNANGSTFDSAFSLIRDTSTATINETVPGSDVIGQDPQLGALADNGGETMTMLPDSTSPGIDCGSDTTSSFDQRGAGFPRVVQQPNRTNSTAAGANGADLGAVEVAASPSITGACANNPPHRPAVVTPTGTPTPTATPAPTPTPTKKKCKKKKHKRSAASAKKKCKKKRR